MLFLFIFFFSNLILKLCGESKEIDEQVIGELEKDIEMVNSKKKKEGNFFEITRSKNEKDKLFIEILGKKESLTYGISFLFEVQISNNYDKEVVKMRSLTPIHFPLIIEKRIGFYITPYNDLPTTLFKNNSDSFFERLMNKFQRINLVGIENEFLDFQKEIFEREKKNFYVGWKPQFISYYQESVQSEIKSLFISFTFLKKFDENNEKKTNLSFLPRSIVNLIANQLVFHSFNVSSK